MIESEAAGGKGAMDPPGLLRQDFDNGGAAAVRVELEYQWESRQANRVNSWQTATYEALAESDWFCDGGFAET